MSEQNKNEQNRSGIFKDSASGAKGGNQKPHNKKSRKPSYLQSLNSKFENEVKAGEQLVVSDGREELFKKYEIAAASKQLVKEAFTSCDMDGTFTRYENGILFVLPGESLSNAGRSVNVYATASLLNVNLSVRVASVDREAGKITFEMPSMGKGALRKAINHEIELGLEGGKRVAVWGRVTKVHANRATVDILGQGILGLIDNIEWQQIYTRSLIGQCQVGELYKFEIYKPALQRPGADRAWILTRRYITDNPWDKLDFTSLSRGGIIVVKCVEKPIDKTFWWGISDRVPGIEIMGDYTGRFSKDGRMVEGISYLCKIEDVRCVPGNIKANRFKVIPFGVAPADMTKLDAYMKTKYGKENAAEDTKK